MKSVALLIETSNAYARGLLTGILRFMRSHEPWSLYLPEQERGASPPKWLSEWEGDGIIARIESEPIAAALSNLHMPIVDLSAARHVESLPFVETNDVSIAELAAAHFSERGFRRLAFCGDPGFAWSEIRKQSFQAIAQRTHVELHTYDGRSRTDRNYSWTQEREQLANWLLALPKPIGIFACYDIKAQQILDVCRDLEIAVPESIAVLGVDNDQLVCELSSPPLSSIMPDALQTGYQAASLMARMMDGESLPPTGHLIDPIGIQTRQSTDILAIDDNDIAVALQFIRENYWRGIQVPDVLQVVPLSRRVLESRFKRYLGRTPREEILRLRLERVKQMLRETDLQLAQVALRCGFENPEYMPVFFKRETGISPSEYRRQHQ